MAYIKCPTCDQPNPSDAETCSNCGAILHESIQPGDFPTKKVTSELEPILPQWLQEAREKARKSTENDIQDSSESPKSGGGAGDLLAGLAAQSEDDEEEVPDWLTGATGIKGKKRSEPKFTGARKVELGGFEGFAQQEQADSSQAAGQQEQRPSWMADLTPAQDKSESSQDLEDWFKQATSAGSEKPGQPISQAGEPGSIEPPAQETALPPASEDQTLDWLNDLQLEETASQQTPQADQLPGETPPSWMQGEQQEAAAPLESGDLPDWLKNLETEGAEGDSAAATSAEAPADDWLAQFKSETPAGEAPADDWMAQLKAETPKEEAPAEDWMGQLPPETPAAEAPAEDWLAQLKAEPPREEAPSDDWMAQIKSEPAAEEPAASEPAAFEAELPDWLKDMTGETPAAEPPQQPELVPPKKAFTTDSLRELGFEQPSSQTPIPPEGEGITLDWLQSMRSVPEAPAEESPEEPGLPDWLNQPAASEPAESPALEEAELPDWMRAPGGADLSKPDVKEEAPSVVQPEPMVPSALDVDLPDWMRDTGALDSGPQKKEEAEMPDWLGGLAALPAEQPEEAGPAEESQELPSWPSSSEPEVPEFQQPLTKDAAPPPFTTPEPLTLGSLDSLLTDVPDWLSEAEETAAPEAAELPPAAEEAETLTPGALPSWVEAMRPVEAGSPGPSKDTTEMVETKGALAGLQGVLPSIPYPGPSSKPKAQFLKLQASEEQQAHAELLEQVLLAETRPEPMTVLPRVTAQRSLRIGIGLILFIVLVLSVLSGSQRLPLPTGIMPSGVQGAKEAVDRIPAGSAVLVVFDYEPSLTGEMEAVAAPVLKYMITRSQPRLAILAATPTGSSLAERLFNGPLGDVPKQYVNLGYLPGGLGGVRSFVQNPAAVMPLTQDGSPAWNYGLMQGVQRLADFSSIIVIVDRADAGRTWIEQSEGLYGGNAFLVISSAQAGPMIQPYYDSRQIQGIVTGLFDAAVLEQNSGVGPGLARRYWDGYNIGLIVAILLIVVGALWNLAAGMRERSSMEVG